MMKDRATREEMFEADDYAMSWAEHQVWRIQRLMNLESARLGVPVESLRLAFESKQLHHLIRRDGERTSYRAEGVIDEMNVPARSNQTMTFRVSWVDPWGFAHSDELNFFEVRLKVMDEFSFRRVARLVIQAKAEKKIH